MFTGPSLSRLFRRNTKKTNRVRPLSRWSRSRLWLTPLEARDVPAQITVTSNLDNTTSGDGSVTLREAIAAIIAVADSGDVVADLTNGNYGTNDEIIFSGGLTGQTITTGATGTDFNITKSMKITGFGAGNLTIANGVALGATLRIFDITSAASTVTITGMKLTGGNLAGGTNNLGGAIRSAAGTLNLSSVTFDANLAVGQATTGQTGGIAAGGALAPTAAGATVTLTNCIFSSNTATGTTTAGQGAGGAIAIVGSTSLTITSSSFSKNSAASTSTNGGGGITVNAQSTITVDSTTFGGATNADGNKSTIVGGAINISGLAGNTQLKFNNSTISNNKSTTAGGAINVVTGGNSVLVEIKNSSITFNTSTTSGGFINTVGTGSITFLNASVTDNLATTDGGVMSLAAANAVTITTSTFSKNTANSSSGGGGVGNASSGVSTFVIETCTFDQNTAAGSGGVFRLNAASQTINSKDSFYTNNFAGLATAGGGAINVNTTSTTTASFTRDTFTGNTGGSGGAIRYNGPTSGTVSPTLTITNSVFTSNSASGQGGTTPTIAGGGAIALLVGHATQDVKILNSTFANNRAEVNGGAILMDGTGPTTIENSTLSSNTAAGNFTATFANAISIGVGGGAIHINGAAGALKIHNSTIVNNVASSPTLGYGGGIFRTSTGGTITLTSSIVANNSAFKGKDFYVSNLGIQVLGGANLIGVADDTNVTFLSDMGPNLTGTKTAPLSPLLAPLANNGGSAPTRQTHALLPGSPAIKAVRSTA